MAPNFELWEQLAFNVSGRTFGDVKIVQFRFPRVWLVFCTRSWKNVTHTCGFDSVAFSQDHCQPFISCPFLLLDLVRWCRQFRSYLRRNVLCFFSATLHFSWALLPKKRFRSFSTYLVLILFFSLFFECSSLVGVSNQRERESNGLLLCGL